MEEDVDGGLGTIDNQLCEGHAALTPLLSLLGYCLWKCVFFQINTVFFFLGIPTPLLGDSTHVNPAF